MTTPLLIQGTALTLPLKDASVHCVVTSPPYYGLRDYGVQSQLGLEPSVEAYVATMVQVFREVYRVLRDDGVLFLNMGDSYNSARGGEAGNLPAQTPIFQRGEPVYRGASSGLKPKNLLGMPWRVALAMQDDGWILRTDIIWDKPSCMPESVQDRPTRSHEYVFLFSKQARYYYDGEAVREPQVDPTRIQVNSGARHEQAWIMAQGVRANAPGDQRGYNPNGRNARTVWRIASEPTGSFGRTSRQVHVARDAVSGDTMCRVSLDCPVHGGLAAQASNAPYDVRVGELLRRTVHTDIDPAQAQLVGSVPTDPQLGLRIAPQSSDSVPLPYAPAATSHNRESHKTAPAPATTAPCTPSDEMSDHTDDNTEQLSCVVPHPDTPASSSVSHDLTANPTPQMPAGTEGTLRAQVSFLASLPPECMCLFYNTIIQEASHFATFPPALVRRCLLAGAPTQVCSKCGAPWKREVERIGTTPGVTGGATPYDALRPDGMKLRAGGFGNGSITTSGFTPTCTCDAGVSPSVVLDPFAGSGTTLLVARELGHHAIGIDLSYPYLRDIARERLGLAALARWEGQSVGDAPGVSYEDLPLFGG